VLGPLLFLLSINDITGNIQSNIRLFADDCNVYHTIRSQDDSCKLQNDISFLLKWAETWQMRFNSKKCHILSISHQCNKSSPVYYLGTDLLSTVSSHTYLGITVSSDLKWHEHISNICLKATRTLNFVRRNTYCCSQEAKNLAYLSLVRPHLQPGTRIWPKISSNSNEFNVVLPVLSKKIIAIQLLSMVCLTNLVGDPCSNVVNTLV